MRCVSLTHEDRERKRLRRYLEVTSTETPTGLESRNRECGEMRSPRNCIGSFKGRWEQWRWWWHRAKEIWLISRASRFPNRLQNYRCLYLENIYRTTVTQLPLQSILYISPSTFAAFRATSKLNEHPWSEETTPRSGKTAPRLPRLLK